MRCRRGWAATWLLCAALREELINSSVLKVQLRSRGASQPISHRSPLQVSQPCNAAQVGSVGQPSQPRCVCNGCCRPADRRPPTPLPQQRCNRRSRPCSAPGLRWRFQQSAWMPHPAESNAQQTRAFTSSRGPPHHDPAHPWAPAAAASPAGHAGRHADPPCGRAPAGAGTMPLAPPGPRSCTAEGHCQCTGCRHAPGRQCPNRGAQRRGSARRAAWHRPPSPKTSLRCPALLSVPLLAAHLR